MDGKFTAGDWILIVMFLSLFAMIIDMGYNQKKAMEHYSFLINNKK